MSYFEAWNELETAMYVWVEIEQGRIEANEAFILSLGLAIREYQLILSEV